MKVPGRLGLEGSVDPDHLRQVLAGVSPSGEILTAGRVDEAKRVAGFDLTWSAPKSVSLLFGLSEPATSAIVRGVHEDAVDQALGYLERHALSVRRGAGGQTGVGAEGLVAAAFTHRTSRAGDPQLHTHVLVANVAKGVDGVWSAPDARLLYGHSRTAGFLYQSALRAGLARALGVRFGEVSRGMAELDGVPKTLLRAFSTRRREIEHQMAETGATSARSAEVAALRHPLGQRCGRRRCHDGGTAPALAGPGRWARLGADRGGRTARAPRGRRALASAELRRGRPAPRSSGRLRGTDGGPVGLRAPRRGAPGGRGPASGIPGGRRRGAGRSSSCSAPTSSPWRASVEEARSATPRSRCWRIERSLLDSAGRLTPRRPRHRRSSGPGVGPQPLPSALRRAVSDGRQPDELGRRSRRRRGQGRGRQDDGPRRSADVVGVERLHGCRAPPSRPGRREDCANGAGIESQTLASLLAGIETGRTRLGAGDVVVLDEAGMVGTRALAQLVESADDAGAKVVLVGDPRQLPEIEAGGALAGLIDRVGAIELTENRRQQSSWERVALDALRMGRASVALATYERAGRIHAAPSMAEAQDAMVGRWAESFREGQDAVMLAASRRDVGSLNELARAELRRSGHLGADLLEVDGLGFAAGDKVICLRNDRRLDVLNGTIGTVEQRRGSGLVVETADGPRALPGEYLEAGHLGHAYAMTVHKSQGMTVERAFVLSSESLSQESGYVAMSRATQSTELFVPLGTRGHELTHDPRQGEPLDPLVDLTRRLQTSRAKQLALFEAKVTEPDGDEETPPKRKALGPSTNASEDSRAGLYGVGQAGRGRIDGESVGGSELSKGPWATGQVSEIDRRLSESRRRIADALARLGRSRTIEEPDRSRGLGR